MAVAPISYTNEQMKEMKSSKLRPTEKVSFSSLEEIKSIINKCVVVENENCATNFQNYATS